MCVCVCVYRMFQLKEKKKKQLTICDLAINVAMVQNVYMYFTGILTLCSLSPHMRTIKHDKISM